MAEQEEFLPHKPGVKKEIRFTDVSASGPAEKKSEEASVLSTGSDLSVTSSLCSLKERHHLACPSLTSVTP